MRDAASDDVDSVTSADIGAVTGERRTPASSTFLAFDYNIPAYTREGVIEIPVVNDGVEEEVEYGRLSWSIQSIGTLSYDNAEDRPALDGLVGFINSGGQTQSTGGAYRSRLYDPGELPVSERTEITVSNAPDTQEGEDMNFTIRLSKALPAELVFHATYQSQWSSASLGDFDDSQHSGGQMVKRVQFNAGETEKNITFRTIVDSIDDDGEKAVFEFILVRYGEYNAQQAHDDYNIGFFTNTGEFLYRIDRYGIIRNDGPLPREWLAEYSHSEASIITDLIANRMDSSSRGGAQEGALTTWAAVAGNSFHNEKLSGSVETVVMGAEQVHGPVTFGAVASSSHGDGDYHGEQAMTLGAETLGLYPYVDVEWSDRFGTWALAGHSRGDITIEGQDTEEIKTGMSMNVGALGFRWALFSSERGGVQLRSSGMWVSASSEEADEIRASKSHSRRLKAELKGSYHILLPDGALTPSLSFGWEDHAGSAIMDRGGYTGRVAMEYRGSHLSLSGAYYTRLDHDTQERKYSGWSASLAYDWGQDERGVTAELRPDQIEMGYGLVRGSLLWTPVTALGDNVPMMVGVRVKHLESDIQGGVTLRDDTARVELRTSW